jgi:hypothetical protein
MAMDVIPSVNMKQDGHARLMRMAIRSVRKTKKRVEMALETHQKNVTMETR